MPETARRNSPRDQRAALFDKKLPIIIVFNRRTQRRGRAKSPGVRVGHADTRRNLSLDGALDAELAHARLQRSALDAQYGGRSPRARDAPLRLPQHLQNMLALGIVKRTR